MLEAANTALSYETYAEIRKSRKTGTLTPFQSCTPSIPTNADSQHITWRYLSDFAQLPLEPQKLLYNLSVYAEALPASCRRLCL